MSADSKIEIERKYAVGADFAMPELSGVPAVASVTAPHTYQLTAVYWDTPGFRLAEAHITLRRRTGGTDAGWHLKLPAGAERREVHAPLDAGTDSAGVGAERGGGENSAGVGAERGGGENSAGVGAERGGGEYTVPAELADLVTGVTGDLPLRPIARLQTARTVRHLMDGAGQVLAEVADDRVTGSLPDPEGAAGSWQVSSSWREVEVELYQGTTDLLAAVGPLLLAAGAQPSPAASKLSLLLTTAGALPAEPGRPA